MIAGFDVIAPRRIVFGAGTSASLTERLGTIGRGPVLVVTGKDPTRHATLIESLRARFRIEIVSVDGEPTVEVAMDAVERARAISAAMVVAIGGGSALDLGKAVAALAPGASSPLDHLEVVGRGKPIVQDPLPFAAVPTTSGTGSEATKNAVLSAALADGSRVKVSLRDDRMMPILAIVDPALTLGVPASVTAATGLDAITQVIEPYVSIAATPFTDALGREAIGRGARAIRRACADGSDLEARSEMSLVSLYGGLALANAKLGAVHGFAGPLGGLLSAPHGAICARLLPFVIEANLAALRERAPSSPAIDRYRDVACWLNGDASAVADDAGRWAHSVVADLAIPTLSQMGMTTALLSRVVTQSQSSSSMKGNPIVLTELELADILARAS